MAGVLKWVVLGLVFIVGEKLVNAHVLVYRTLTNQLLEEFNDLPAHFGPSLPPNGLKVYAVPANPSQYACEILRQPPRSIYPSNAKFVALISRGGDCTFERKVRVAQNASYYAVIVYNNEGDDLEQMSADNSTGIHIQSVFVGHSTGKALQSYYSPDVVLIINDELPFNINTQLLLPFSILIGLCFLIMVIYMICRCIREQRNMRRYRLPKNLLKKIPMLRYTKNNPSIKYETCVICLEDFAEDDKLRVLPCSHPYHSHCIDPWLTQNRRVCPICKRKVFTKGETRASRNRHSSSDSVTDTDDDTTPLLQQANAILEAASFGSTEEVTAAASTTTHGTFRRPQVVNNGSIHAPTAQAAQPEENDSSDDDALLAPSTQRRINPFDRSPNLPAHLAVQLSGETPSLWSRINGFLFRRPVSVAAPPYLDHLEAGTSTQGLLGQTTTTAAAVVATTSGNGSAALATPTSNNILNPNLSGSFKDDDDMPPHRSIYEPIAATTPGSNRIASASEAVDSEFLQTPTQGGIGVAALPPNGEGGGSRQFLI
ncbi:E3 ubiquitin-protein ligase RNF13 [Scaptodrosophila lebanonensis]|uniref:RING-type E3 ubiquitin transferase n=1 Tax=Drosophila lebanonensis TaxID=7225 RepID=A0A6J2TEK3_DROLE|nr:E3 ubiquitin-protein ligase RNF13 [Scaptodrosophila lebanonensis]XP_030373543.1 E3 ubiquitin-protein ligase RNF13 [Scaptodrosophila lebanonensis]